MIKSADRFSTEKLSGRRAIIKIEDTQRRDGEWIVSGNVVLPLVGTGTMSGGLQESIDLSFPFKDARNEENALHQAVLQMRALAQTLNDLADGFAQEAHPSSTRPGEPSGHRTP